jgi:hypothetical protein
MNFKIIINDKGESIPYRKIVQIPYALAETEVGFSIILENQLELLKLFENYKREEIKIYVNGQMLLISFIDEIHYYCLYDLPNDYTQILKQQNKVQFIFSDMDSFLVFDKINE